MRGDVFRREGWRLRVFSRMFHSWRPPSPVATVRKPYALFRLRHRSIEEGRFLIARLILLSFAAQKHWEKSKARFTRHLQIEEMESIFHRH
ncbi:hypothetical protein NPIL_101581 [Nephila pilipes]|uniref:Uncharacterized protein n=1 Tax=Nephila pilipes TaxID=299642 RepID=A0A8X6U6N6_NEPPI|nr:hypothetical protein NPIL_101581 [Nephila pilipes]